MATQAFERLYRLTVDGTQAERQLKKLNTTTSGIAQGFNQMRSAAVSAFGVFTAARGLQSFVAAADKLDLMRGSFEALTDSAERAGDLTERVFRTIAETGSGLDDTISTFQRLTIGMENLGASNDQIDAVANTFIKLGRISGTSMANTNSALVQFSQGLATGRLQGDELRSIMERLPLITQLIAKEWNRVNEGVEVTGLEIKQLGREGKLTADILVNALLNAFDEVNDQFGKLVFTLDQELNVLGLRITQAFAEVSVKTGLGDAVKASVQTASRALADFTRNVADFSQDIGEINLSLKAATNGFIGLADVMLLVLMPALIKVANSIHVFARANPLVAFFSVMAVAIPLFIARWDDIKNLMLNQVPSWFNTMKGVVLEVFADISVGWQNMWTELIDIGTSSQNALIRGFNAVSEALNFGGSKQPAFTISERDFVPAEEGFSQLKQWAKDAYDAAAAYALKYGLQMAKNAEQAIAQAKALELLELNAKKGSLLGDPEEVQKMSDEMADFTKQVLGTLDPLYKLGEVVDELHTLMSLGLLTEDQVNLYLDMMDGTAEAAEKAAEALKKNNQEWEAYALSVTDALDPMQEILRTFDKVDMAVEGGFLKAEDAEAFKKTLIDVNGQIITTTENIKTMAEQIKTAIDGFVKDFTNNLVDGLKKGEFAFKQFAVSILETMAKIVLNSIFEKFFTLMMQNWGVSSSGGGGGGGFLRAGGGEDTGHSVGLLQSPTYGRAQGAGAAAVKVNVYNNSTATVATETSQNSDGSFNIELFIEQSVNAAINKGGLDKSMKSSFGLSRRAF